MKTIEYRDVIDKKGWPKGEWNQEPDKKQWLDKETSLPCLILRNMLGTLCGYVGVFENHPFYKKDYDEVYGIKVHGGLTFADSCQENAPENRGICHIVNPYENDKVWWLGFDCSHFDDMYPTYTMFSTRESNHTYKNWQYVENEVKNLAKQLKAFELTENLGVFK